MKEQNRGLRLSLQGAVQKLGSSKKPHTPEIEYKKEKKLSMAYVSFGFAKSKPPPTRSRGG
jgi:hypothetical protein